jgi:hypothetical protein
MRYVCGRCGNVQNFGAPCSNCEWGNLAPESRKPFVIDLEQEPSRIVKSPDPAKITETTTLGQLREQLKLLKVASLQLKGSSTDDTVEAVVLHEGDPLKDLGPAFYTGKGTTPATAIETAFSALRRALLPEPLKQYLTDLEKSDQ